MLRLESKGDRSNKVAYLTINMALLDFGSSDAIIAVYPKIIEREEEIDN